MTPIEPTADAPQQDTPDFDTHAEAIFAQTRAPQDAQAGPEEQAAVVAAEPVAQGAPPEDEPDDDDETLPFDQRFARAQRREGKITARATEAEAARQKALDQVNGYSGRLKQEQTRAAALEAERDRFKQQADDTNAAINGIWEARIASTTDPEERAAWQAQYDFDRTKREVEAERKQLALEREQQQQQAARVKQEQIDTATAGLREHVVPSLVGPMEQFATVLGLPLAEIADIRATLNSRPMQQLFARLSPEELDAYRNELGEGIFTELAQRNLARKQRETGQNRTAAAEVYRAERPVGQGGGGSELEALAGLDFDDAFAANARNQRRLAGERVSA